MTSTDPSMRIEQHHSFLVDLLRHVQAGRMAPAAFQRPYVWSPQDVEALCDSVLNGFPLGGFLIWRPTVDTDLSNVAGGRLGPLTLGRSTDQEPRACHPPVDLLLDGQNRLASFAWMGADHQAVERLSDLSDAERTTWCSGRTLTADALTRTIRFMTDDEAQASLSLPAHLIAFPLGPALNRAVRQRMDHWEQRFGEARTDAAMTWFDTATHAFREARVTHTVLVNATPDEARHAFLRICKVGVPMSQEDFDRAIGWTPAEALSQLSNTPMAPVRHTRRHP